MVNRIKDPISSLTHLIGALLSIAGLVLLVYYAATGATTWHVVTFTVFGISLILLYSASTVYHTLIVSDKVTRVLRKIDHMMIYILIAGTYTPICLIPLRGAWGWSLFGSIWGIAVIGIVLTGLWLDAPRWLSTTFYAIMGWLVIIAFLPLIKALSAEAMGWLVAGGIIYTIGAVIYGTKWPKINWKFFGFHEIFHLFVMAGSFCHFWLMFRYVLYI